MNRKDSPCFSPLVKSLFRYGKEIEQLVDVAEKRQRKNAKNGLNNKNVGDLKKLKGSERNQLLIVPVT